MPAMSDFKEEKHQSESHPGRSRDKSLPVRDLTVAEERKGPPSRILFPSESLATDGGLIAITDVSEAMSDTGLESDYRVVGGIAVMLHVLRTGVDIPIRSTGDADYGVPPRVLTEGKLVREIERRGYTKTEGNRWERQIDDDRTATVDLLIPAYTSRARSSRQVGEVNTTEVPGLAEAFLAEPCVVDAEFILTNGEHLNARVLLPDSKSMILLKAGARRVRNEDRDATDLWRCLEVANADGVIATDFTNPDVAQIRDLLQRELGRDGAGLAVITRDLSPEAAGQTATRIQALLGRIVGV
jgi:hypothetical protein